MADGGNGVDVGLEADLATRITDRLNVLNDIWLYLRRPERIKECQSGFGILHGSRGSVWGPGEQHRKIAA